MKSGICCWRALYHSAICAFNATVSAMTTTFVQNGLYFYTVFGRRQLSSAIIRPIPHVISTLTDATLPEALSKVPEHSSPPRRRVGNDFTRPHPANKGQTQRRRLNVDTKIEAGNIELNSLFRAQRQA